MIRMHDISGLRRRRTFTKLKTGSSLAKLPITDTVSLAHLYQYMVSTSPTTNDTQLIFP